MLCRVTPCIVKACIWPRYYETLCFEHFHFFDYPISMTGKHLDLENLYNRDDPDPARTYFSILPYWERNVDKFEKSLKLEMPGKITVSVNGIRVPDAERLDARRNLQLSVTWKMKGWGKKKIRKVQRHRGPGWHGNHPDQKPIKRWSRELLEYLPTVDADGVLRNAEMVSR